MIKISVDKQSELSVLNSLKAMTLPPKRRKRLLQSAAKGSVQTSRKNQRNQKAPKGRKWQGRANKSRKKMQVRLARLLTVTGSDGNAAMIGWRKGATARVAAKHHYGHRQRHTRASAIKALRHGNKGAS
ncbi:TPA: hypothetical protein KD853_000740 [Vibrio parahaemolyticus]|uniref:Phage virion morphogenesis protein n=1 Tax=Vibrio parahaemolyticus TaxID=670 RepID=A0AA46UNP4_VIBPH|nr:hypothetical protein [Vibrio parahaemolyticus]EGR1734089.1 hypothetical protein [Vibrio parahaemolyticus]EGX7686684.1 hypothetical protein [Vibrio parahaemolyticus]EHH1172440.1 hypothetical protein [Vibrio parahaemolyticus]EKB1966844.1 hypothetical protein [Vibrio parahaemolyticus]MBE4282874.1 hypothetical protein [Vibrio parahaemolyticus]